MIKRPAINKTVHMLEKLPNKFTLFIIIYNADANKTKAANTNTA